MTIRDIRLAAVVLVAGALLAPAAQAQTTLRYKFKADEKLNYEIQQKMSMKIDIAGKDLELGMNQTIDMVWNIQSVDKNGKAKMTQKFERFRFSMDSPMGKIDYDSKDGKLPNDPIGQALAPVFKALSGLEVTLYMDPLGELSDVTIPEKFLEAIKGAGQGAPFGDMFTPDGLKKMMAQSGLTLPKEAVTKGKTWSQKVNSKLPFGEMKMDNGFTYEGQAAKDGQKLEQVALKTAITLEADPNAPLAMKLKDGSGKGTAYFNNESGRLQELIMTQAMTLEALGQNMRITQTIGMKLKQ